MQLCRISGYHRLSYSILQSYFFSFFRSLKLKTKKNINSIVAIIEGEHKVKHFRHLLGKTSAKDFFLTQLLQHSPPMLFIKILRKAKFIFGNQVYVKSCLCLKKRNYYWRSSFLCQNEETEEKESKND